MKECSTLAADGGIKAANTKITDIQLWGADSSEAAHGFVAISEICFYGFF